MLNWLQMIYQQQICHPERSLARSLRQTESKDLRLLFGCGESPTPYRLFVQYDVLRRLNASGLHRMHLLRLERAHFEIPEHRIWESFWWPILTKHAHDISGQLRILVVTLVRVFRSRVIRGRAAVDGQNAMCPYLPETQGRCSVPVLETPMSPITGICDCWCLAGNRSFHGALGSVPGRRKCAD
jgi:hypothetical protein